MKTTLHLLVLGTALSAVASGEGLAPYMTIVERMPFGRPPAEQEQAEDGTEASAAGGSGAQDVLDPEAEEIAEHIRETVRVCAVNAPPGGEPVVGFTDTAQNPPKHYLLAQGQSKDGWAVLLVDAPERHAVLSRDGISVSLYLGLPQRTEVGKGMSDPQAESPDDQIKPHRRKNTQRTKNAKRPKRAHRSKRPKHTFRNPPPEGGGFLVYCGCFRGAGALLELAGAGGEIPLWRIRYFALTRKRRSTGNLAVSMRERSLTRSRGRFLPSRVSLSTLSLMGTPRPPVEGDRRGTHFL